MNNDLEQFSEERLKQIIELSKFTGGEETLALARIALAAKQAKPVGYISERNLNALGKQFSVCVKHEPVMVRPIPIYTTPQPAHTEQVIPDGWKLVPMTVTIEMHKAAEKEYSLQKMYSAMLRAAPKPESE